MVLCVVCVILVFERLVDTLLLRYSDDNLKLMLIVLFDTSYTTLRVVSVYVIPCEFK